MCTAVISPSVVTASRLHDHVYTCQTTLVTCSKRYPIQSEPSYMQSSIHSLTRLSVRAAELPRCGQMTEIKRVTTLVRNSIHHLSVCHSLAFSISVPRLWNNLPPHLTNNLSSINWFKRHLKSCLYMLLHSANIVWLPATAISFDFTCSWLVVCCNKPCNNNNNNKNKYFMMLHAH